MERKDRESWERDWTGTLDPGGVYNKHCILTKQSPHSPLTQHQSLANMSIPAKQKTLFLPAVQGVMTVQVNDVPKPGPDDLLIKIEAAALNPVDWKIIEIGLFLDKYPAVLGLDGAGTVVAVGTNVTDFKIGDRVYVADS